MEHDWCHFVRTYDEHNKIMSAPCSFKKVSWTIHPNRQFRRLQWMFVNSLLLDGIHSKSISFNCCCLHGGNHGLHPTTRCPEWISDAHCISGQIPHVVKIATLKFLLSVLNIHVVGIGWNSAFHAILGIPWNAGKNWNLRKNISVTVNAWRF